MKEFMEKHLQLKAYSAPDVAAVLGLSKSSAYGIMDREDFPLIRIGSRKLVSIEQFDNWLQHAHTPPLSQQAQHDNTMLHGSCAERGGQAHGSTN